MYRRALTVVHGLAQFSVSKLFAALRGAWLEPQSGAVFTDTGGATAVTTGGQSIARINDQSGWGNNATQATAANRPVYGARYNLLTYTEDFSNAAWTKTTTGSATAIQFTNNYAVAPDGTTTAARFTATVTGTAGSDISIVQLGSGATLPKSITTSLWVKSNTGSEQNVWFRGGSPTGASVPVTNNWTKITDSGAINYFTLGLRGSITGVSSIDILVWHPDQRLTSYVGKDPAYQRITTATDYDVGQYPAAVHDATDTLTCSLPNLGGGVFSSAGSVYFATPVGMSALHNQSMGTSYNLPALSTDIYSWVVFPQRLSAAQETQLERYMLGKAGLAVPDYLLDSSDNQLTDDSGNDIILAA